MSPSSQLSGPYEQVLAQLKGGATPERLVVDLDGVAYAGGALFTLSRWCPPETLVIAIGSDPRPERIREILRAGVGEYLLTPVTDDRIEAAFKRLLGTAPGAQRAPVVAFASIGGSGATSLAAAFAVHCCARGRYVSAVDFDRTFSALVFTFGHAPTAGFDQLLLPPGSQPAAADTLAAAATSSGPRLKLYGYRWAGGPSAPPDDLGTVSFLDTLSQQTHCVVVDGLAAPRFRFNLLDLSDHRVLVADPSPQTLAFAARAVSLFRTEAPTTLVVNASRRGTRAVSSAFPPLPAFVDPPVVLPFSRPFAQWLDFGVRPDAPLPRFPALASFLGTLYDRVFRFTTSS